VNVTTDPRSLAPLAKARKHPAALAATGTVGPRGVRFRALSRANSSDVLRDPATMFFSLIFPLLMLGLFVVIAQLTWVRGPYEMDVTGSGAPALVQALDRDGNHVDQAGPALRPGQDLPDGVNAIVVADASSRTVSVVVSPDKVSAAEAVKDAAAAALPGWTVRAATPDGSAPFNPVQFMIPGALAFALISLGLNGTAAPLVTVRARGTLRLLSTTPAGRATTLLSFLPVRLVLAGVQLALLATAAAAAGYLEPAAAARVLLTALLALAALLGVGFLIGGTMRNPDLTNGVLGILSPVLLLGGGLFLPLTALPPTAGTVLGWSPLALLGDALRADLAGIPPQHPVWLTWVVLTATAIASGWLAVRCFRFDTEPRVRASRRSR